MEEAKIINFYQKHKDKGRYWVADILNLNRSYFCSLIDKHFPNSSPLNSKLEEDILSLIKLYPYTGTMLKISKILKVSKHTIQQVFLKTQNKIIKQHFTSPKYASKKITDNDIKDILEGSKKGIGNDLMGEKLGVDGTTVRYIRKKFLTSEEYKTYHSINRYQNLEHLGYYNNRGDKLLSSLEEQVCDYLFTQNIKYKTNIKILSFPNSYIPDILLTENNLLIEIFGMSNVSFYKERMLEKIKFYNQNNIKCLFLYEEDFKENLEWQNKINIFLEETKGKKFNINLKI
jgi:hypothetical protein